MRAEVKLLGVAEAILQRKKRVSYRRVACEQARDGSRRFGREDRIRLRGIDAKGGGGGKRGRVGRQPGTGGRARCKRSPIRMDECVRMNV